MLSGAKENFLEAKWTKLSYVLPIYQKFSEVPVVFLVVPGTSSFPARHEVYGKT